MQAGIGIQQICGLQDVWIGVAVWRMRMGRFRSFPADMPGEKGK